MSHIFLGTENITVKKTYMDSAHFQVVQVAKNPPAIAGDVRDEDSIPRLGRSPEGGHGNPLYYSCLGKPIDRGECWATVHSVPKSHIQLKRFSTRTQL